MTTLLAAVVLGFILGAVYVALLWAAISYDIEVAQFFAFIATLALLLFIVAVSIASLNEKPPIVTKPSVDTEDTACQTN